MAEQKKLGILQNERLVIGPCRRCCKNALSHQAPECAITKRSSLLSHRIALLKELVKSSVREERAKVRTTTRQLNGAAIAQVIDDIR